MRTALNNKIFVIPTKPRATSRGAWRNLEIPRLQPRLPLSLFILRRCKATATKNEKLWRTGRSAFTRDDSNGVKNSYNKPLLLVVAILALGTLTGCSVNPATGQSQFAGFMSPQQENTVGAQEHPKIIDQYGEYKDPKINEYVRRIGAKVTANTERPDVQYKFYVLDTPIVNAFALPGGYIYVSRGLLALANSEAELAAVLAHEAGHITGRHSAERYSTSVVTSLGASILSATIDQAGVSQALNLGSNLYLSSYSRGQENEADTLGIRYMSRAGYDPSRMTTFLGSLKASSDLEARIDGRSNGFSYFSTHPATQDRVNKTRTEVAQTGKTDGVVNRNAHMKIIDGLPYGDSAAQGFARGNSFYHPDIGFAFDVPRGFKIKNTPSAVIAAGQGGSAIIFDMAKRTNMDAATYLQQGWMKGEDLSGFERITINGMNAATASFRGNVNGQSMTVRLVAIEYSANRFVRFQMAIPLNAGSGLVQELKSSTYSFRKMSAADKKRYQPLRLKVVAAKSGDTVGSLASRMGTENYKEEYFRVLNGLTRGQNPVPGQLYKLVVQ